VPRKGKGFVRGNAMGIPGQFHSAQTQNLYMHDQPAANPLDMPGAQMHKMYMNTHREQFQRFRPYFNMDEVEQDTQYDVTDEHRWLVRIPLLVCSSIILYFLYNRVTTYMKFYNYDNSIKNLDFKDFDIKGMLVVESGKTKFDQKYLSRGEYHKWLENDIRTFK
jgi:hypothetical protein